MTTRERFAAAMRFEKADRMPMLEWATWWDQTVERWRGEGLAVPEIAGLNAGEALQEYFGLDLHMQYWFSITGPQTPKPAYHGAPLCGSLAEYERLRPALYPESLDTARLEAMAKRQGEGTAIAWITLDGFFWGPRSLLGITPHLLAFYDEPALMHRICEDILSYNLRVLERVFAILTPDFMTFGEDMSYNNGPMISEAMFDEFMLPYYQRIVPVLKARGVRVLVDSDGDISRALPWFLRAGIEGILPLERQAGVDLNALRARFPRALFIGHFDKMCMSKGEEALRAEFERLLPVMRKGGFIASVDHQTPPSVTLAQYKIYLRLLREYAEKAMR